ncbi:MAG: hypothetical protein EXQ70_06935, partial [Solirubrobacterales bacterium]|nr:hypothetical protein [Solirubrobacterales bacterium]
MSPTTSLLTDSEISRGLRRGRVLSGERMVTPRKHLSLVVNGRTEELRPGRDRLRPDHWTVREHPEWFKP